jgi:hypothetical protein
MIYKLWAFPTRKVLKKRIVRHCKVCGFLGSCGDKTDSSFGGGGCNICTWLLQVHGSRTAVCGPAVHV